MWAGSVTPRRVLAFIVAIIGTVGSAKASDQVTISSEHLAVRLSSAGVDSIALDGKPVTDAAGLSLWNDAAIGSTAGMLPSPGIATQAKVDGEADHATVEQSFDDLHVVWTYRVSGYDLLADIAVTDTGDKPFDRFFFQLPRFHFSRPPDGTMHCWHDSYYGSHWKNLAHPSLQSPLAVADAYDESFGIAIHCKSHFDRSVLINTNFDHNIIPAQCVPYVYVDQTVEPGNTAHVQLTVRITNKLDLANRVGAYVSDFTKWAGPMLYHPDDRPVIGCFPESTTWITKSNPLGLSRRLDYLGGVLEFERLISPAVPYCQGPILWQPQGAAVRGVEYRPDFDVWPPTIRQNLPILLSWCSNHGMRPGLQARPMTIVTPLNFTSDQSIDLCPDEPSQVNMVEARFANTMAVGAKEFYLDSFGTDLPSYHLMQKLRAKLGPDIPTYSEFTSDLMLPLSGAYMEAIGREGNTLWYHPSQLKMMRLLYSQSTFICRPHSAPDPATGAPALSFDDYAKFKLSPIVFDADSVRVADDLKEMRAKYYDGDVWGSAAGSGIVATTQP